jgi:hypothetical protein
MCPGGESGGVAPQVQVACVYAVVPAVSVRAVTGLVVSSCGYVDMKMCGYVDTWICRCVDMLLHSTGGTEAPTTGAAGT